MPPKGPSNIDAQGDRTLGQSDTANLVMTFVAHGLLVEGDSSPAAHPASDATNLISQSVGDLRTCIHNNLMLLQRIIG